MFRSIYYRIILLTLLHIISVKSVLSKDPSYLVQTRNAHQLYKKLIKEYKIQDEEARRMFDKFYSDRNLYGKKKHKSNKPIKDAAFNFLMSQSDNLASVSRKTKAQFEKKFSQNCCNTNELALLIRKIALPQTFYSHLSSVNKGFVYVFYILTDYDPATGTGIYFQSDAFYPRDAFSFPASAFCPDSAQLEFYTGVFMLTYSDLLRKDVVCLLTPENDFNGRKEFEITADESRITLIKKMEYKKFNYYPLATSEYTITELAPLQKGQNTSFIFQPEFDELDKLVAEDVDKGMYKIKQETDTILKDSFYPLKGSTCNQVDSGWVYLGQVGKKEALVNETFFRFQDGVVGLHTQIDCLAEITRAIERKSYVKPFDVIKVREKIPRFKSTFTNFSDPTIIGEAYPDCKYVIREVFPPGDMESVAKWAYIVRVIE